MCVDVTCSRCPFTMTVEMGKSWDKPGYFLIHLTVAAAAFTGHSWALCPFSCPSSVFWMWGQCSW
jgi:hypothetical protein